MAITYNTIEEALQDLRNGKCILVTDDPDRENEGDLICAGQFATTENVNLMASAAKGLICMPMSHDNIVRLGLTQMVSHNTDNHETAFTVSIDHIDTTTGISAVERGLTARMAADPAAHPGDFRRPGHMFPLEAKPGGVLERNGHTEATVDLLRLAGLTQVGLCCEIMDDDGTMMRGEKLADFAKQHGLSFITIRELQHYRRNHDNFVEEVARAELPTVHGHFQMFGFRNTINGDEHVALVMGDVSDGKPVLCRVHSECLTGDVFGSCRCDCGEQLNRALDMIRGQRRSGLSAPGGQRHRSAEQDPGVQVTGGWSGHRRGKHQAGLCAGSPGLQRRCADSEASGRDFPAAHDQQSGKDRRTGRIRTGSCRACSH